MKKQSAILLAVLAGLSLFGCSAEQAQSTPPAVEEEEAPALQIKPETAQIRNICELATMECYYHNVAKYNEEDAEGFLFWTKDKRFWIEYSGIVTLGVDVNRVSMELSDDGTQVTITLPPATVQNCTVDEDSLTKDSFIVAKDSADITAEDEQVAFTEAKDKMMEAAESNTALLAEARFLAEDLLRSYIENIGNLMGTSYDVDFVYLEDEVSSPEPASSEPGSETTEAE